MSDIIRWDIDDRAGLMFICNDGDYVQHIDYETLEDAHMILQSDYEDLIEELRQVRKEYNTLVNKLGEIYRDA